MAQTIFDVRRFLIQKLIEANSSVETRSGSGYGTIVIKPMSILLAPYASELEEFRTRLSLADVSSLGSEATDDLIANLFIDRIIGNVASGSVRLFFASPQDKTVAISSGFVSVSGLLYLASSTIRISAGAMSINREGTEYYMDVPIIASSIGSEYNTDANTITSTETDIVGVTRITNPSEVKNGIATETDQEFVDRAGLAITVRNLINQRSVQTVLRNTFNFIESLTAIGYREPEMIRDLLEGVITSLGPVDLNIGGHADIYIEPVDNQSVSVDIPSSAMTGELIVSTNIDRGEITESVKSGLFIDIKRGFFNGFEIEEQFGVELNPSSTYYIYLDVAGVLQLDDVGGAFPTNSIPLAIVTTDAFHVTSVTDSREDLIDFTRPMVFIESIVELDPVTLTPTERSLTDGHDTLLDTDLSVIPQTNPSESNFAISPLGIAYTAFVSGDEVFLSGYNNDGTIALSPVNVSGSSPNISRNPTVSIDSQGSIHVIYEDDTGGQFDPYHSRLSSTGSVEVAAASLGVTAGIIGLDCEIDQADRLHLAWIEGTQIQYQKIDRDGATVIASTTLSSTSYAKADPDIGLNGNTVTSNTDGEANGNTTFNGTFPVSVAGGQELVLSGGSLAYSAIMYGDEAEPGPFAATLTGTVQALLMDTSVGSGFNEIEITLDGGVPITVTFTNTASNPVTTVASEINTQMGASIASVGPNNEIILTSTTTGYPPSELIIVTGNDGIGFATGVSDTGGTGYDVSVVSGNNTLDLRVDGVDLQIVFPDIKGRLLTNIVADINAESLASSLASNIASSGPGSVLMLTSPGTGVSSFIEVTLGNDAIGLETDDREEGGSELGKRVGIVSRDSSTQITLNEALRTVSTSPDIIYTIESVEAGVVWSEDGDIFLAKIDDAASIFFAAANMTRIEVQASGASASGTPMANGPGSNEITFLDSGADFITAGVVVGDTVRVTATTPGGDEGDYLVKQVNGLDELVLTGTIVGPNTAATYEIFKTEPGTKPQITTNTDNESQIVWVNTLRKISSMETNRLGVVTRSQGVLVVRPNNIPYLSSFTDNSDGTHIAWIENENNSGDAYLMRIDEFGDVVLDPVLLKDILENSEDIHIKADSENQPYIIWTAVNNASMTSKLIKIIRSAQDYFFKVNDPTCSLSMSEDNSIVFTKEFIGQPVQVTYKTSEDIETISDYVQSDDERVFTENYKVKHTIMAVVTVSITYDGSVNEDDAQQAVIDFINGVEDERLEASDIKNALYTAGATFVSVPFSINVVYRDVDGSRIELVSQDFIEIPRIARYFSTTSTVTVTKMSS